MDDPCRQNEPPQFPQQASEHARWYHHPIEHDASDRDRKPSNQERVGIVHPPCEITSQVTLAMTQGSVLGKIASANYPYPDGSRSDSQTGEQYNQTHLTREAQNLLSLLRRLKLAS